ncbi:choline kinase [Verticillium dahliae VdLs.17]|uniref:Choline kinase n=1 Tax=Verticillium dahliae (strain VdLs.17 / ATCC MYA-4575 / FGSC 10137) TaxID=498257 RepID=G2WVU0_VERDV|nr:choline kinase [Verticillium dahliae VdLs.17]EGY19710.1 choline kinase [Verticillium dahliae VdLs.17]
MSDSPLPNVTASASSQPLRSALKNDEDNDKLTPQCGTPKSEFTIIILSQTLVFWGSGPYIPGAVVQIVDPEAVPQPEQESESTLPAESSLKRQFSAGIAKRLSGRNLPTSSSRTSLSSMGGQEAVETPEESSEQQQQQQQQQHHIHGHGHGHERRKQHYVSQKLLSQVSDWLEHERRKREQRQSGSHASSSRRKRPQQQQEAQAPAPAQAPAADTTTAVTDEKGQDGFPFRHRTDSIDSQSSDMSFDKLQRILEENMAALGLDSIPHLGPKLPQRPSVRGHKKSGSRSMLHRTASSDTDYADGDVVVPSCDAVLDNSKTMSYNAGKSSDNLVSGKAEAKEHEAWSTFRNEIIRLAHTLRIKGWRRIPLEAGDKISVQRLSGALTNAVYVVTPPEDLEPVPGKKQPSKVLLRIYGPQVEHLIDRDNELSVLGRLARKRIGPRLLGTFTNGRFEEYFNSVTLTPKDLRDSETSKQIAKRMRELHDGIELLDAERKAGPSVWGNWDKWLDNVEKRVMAVDDETRARQAGEPVKPTSTYQGQGFLLPERGRHQRPSDTQYGNILRVRPDDKKSPLLKPANEHKQLIVIDFEYAGANVPGQEFANHFTEWAYNYHDEAKPHGCSVERYPTVEEQRRFIRSYVEHRPKFPHASSTPRLTPLDTPGHASGGTPVLHPTSSSSSIVDFMLDARVPAGCGGRPTARSGSPGVSSRPRCPPV